MPYGVIINSIAVFGGGMVGAVLKMLFPDRLKHALPGIFGLSAVAMGIVMIIKMESMTAVVLSLILGTIVGELLNLESRLLCGLTILNKKLPVGIEKEQQDVLSSMIVLFCFSGTGIFGAMNAAITGDHSILITKSVMDFFTALIFATTVGYVIGLICVPQFLVGTLLFASAALIMPYMTDTVMADFNACGGMITLAVGLKILEIKSMRVLNMLPAILLVLPVSTLWGG